MKEIEIVVFTTLRDQYLNGGLHPAFKSVHAVSRKFSSGFPSGYGARKRDSTTRVLGYLEKKKLAVWEEWFKNQQKKDDLSDCLCMVLDSK